MGFETGRSTFTLTTLLAGACAGSFASRTGSTGARVASVSVPSANTTGIVSASGLNIVRPPTVASIRTSYLRSNVPWLDGRIEHLAHGSVNNVRGVYHITTRGDTIIHRVFVPESDWARFSRIHGLPNLSDIPRLN